MEDFKILDEKMLEKVTGGALIEDGPSGYYYAHYYYYWTPDYQTMNKQEGEMGPYDSAEWAEIQVRDKLLEIRDPSDVRHSSKYEIIYKYKADNPIDDGVLERVKYWYVE